jgi:thioredoxin reductase (NADPH)
VPSSLLAWVVRSYDHGRVGDNGPTSRPAGMSPLLVAVDDDPDLLRDVERELRNRYEPDYRVCCLRSTSEALATLQELAAAGEQVALVLAGEVLSGAPGTEVLAEVRSLFPRAQRALLIGWGHLGSPRIGEAIFEAISRGRMDHYVVRPSAPPDEQFHLAISSFLLTWADAQHSAPNTIAVVGETWSARSRRPPTSRSGRAPRSSTAVVTAGWTTWCCANAGAPGRRR